MKAVYYTKTGDAKNVLKVDTFDDPAPKKNQVVVQTSIEDLLK